MQRPPPRGLRPPPRTSLRLLLHLSYTQKNPPRAVLNHRENRRKSPKSPPRLRGQRLTIYCTCSIYL